jgi:hypothetical protein
MAKDQVSHPYETEIEVIVLYVLILSFLNIRPEDKRFSTDQ